MKPARKFLSFGTVFALSFNLLHAQQASFSSGNAGLESIMDVSAMMEALATVEPVPFASLPRNKCNRVSSVGYWSAQHLPGSRAAWPPLPGNFWNLDVWPLGGGVFILDDRSVDYAAIEAEADAEAALAASASPRMRMSMVMSSLSSSYAYGNPVYLTNLVVSAAGYQPMAASFDVAGGTNNVPYDIWMTTNLLNKISQSQWTWLGIGYTSFHYTFTNQPLDMAFYALTKPQHTIVLAWGPGSSGAPSGLTNAVMVAGGNDFSLALKADGTVTTWGSNSHGQTNVPTGLTNVTVIVCGYYHSLTLRADGTLAIWGSWWNNSYFPTPTLPSGLTNVVAISAGVDHDIAAKADGTVVVWGYTNEIYNMVLPGLSGVKDVEAGWNHNVALLTNGTVVAWGANYASFGWYVTNVPAGLSDVVAIAAGGYHTLALKSDGTVVAWGAGNSIYGFWWADQGQSIVPAGLSNVVAIAAGGFHSQALKRDGTVVMWGDLSLPSYQLNQIIGIGSGVNHALALYGDHLAPPVITSQSPMSTNQIFGVAYQTNVTLSVTATAPGMTNGFPLGYQWQANGTNITSANAASYNFNAMVGSFANYSVIVSNIVGSVTSLVWQVTVTNAINVTNDLLLIYNTNSADSAFVKDYYLAHRPMVGGANVLGIGYTNSTSPGYYECISPTDLTNLILNPVGAWLTNNPAKRPQYVILFLDVPSRVFTDTTYPTNGNYPRAIPIPSVSVQLRSVATDWQPFITHVNMNGTNDCIAYINKVATFGTNYSPGKLVISASAGGYGNANFVLDGIRNGGPDIPPFYPYENYSGFGSAVSNVINNLLSAGISSSAIFFYDGLVISNNVAAAPPHATGHTNMAGYICWGLHGGLGNQYALDGKVTWSGNSGWWLIRTIESFNGLRIYDGQGTFVKWYSSNAFGGTNFSNTPIGAVSSTDEPGVGATDSALYFGLWASGKNFGICAWKSIVAPYFQAVGDPFICK